ncbi:MAG: hypothetical protein DWQ36_18130 [Acidobacteria bacterium]|nr:MAG: hypothetical protein DWQ30_15420 [Acidobacteriota bacterium]REK04350.1 MAG: hypothetical protein DWQ36_18130 [Acidobacteriota bacterium]
MSIESNSDDRTRRGGTPAGESPATPSQEVVTCAQARPFLSARIDGEELSRPVARHLSGCSGCARELGELRAVSELLRVDEMPRDPGFVVRFRQLREARLGLDPARFWRAWTLRLAPLAAGVCLATALVLSAGPDRDEQGLEWGVLGEGSEIGSRVAEDLTLIGGVAWFDAEESALGGLEP